MDIFDILTLIGGLCLFLFGMNVMGDGLERRAGGGLKLLLGKLTNNRMKGFLTGLGVTAVIQSSSATTVMVVGFVNSGLMTLKQSIGVIMGANIGTTVTAQLLAFRVESWRYLLLFCGVLLCLACKGWRGRCVGEAVFGFGLLFEGVTVMRSAMEPLLQSPAGACPGAAKPLAWAADGRLHDLDGAEQLCHGGAAAKHGGAARGGRRAQPAGADRCHSHSAGG